MEEQKKPSYVRYQYQIPSKLQVEDKIVSLGPFSLTLRQTLILILGSCIAMNIWRSLGATMLPIIVRVILTVFPVAIGFLWGMVKISGRYTEAWVFILWRYLNVAKTYRWRQSAQSHLERTAQKRRPKKKRAAGWSDVDEESE